MLDMMVECLDKEINRVYVNGMFYQIFIFKIVDVEVEFRKCCLWFEEELEEDFCWVFGVFK